MAITRIFQELSGESGGSRLRRRAGARKFLMAAPLWAWLWLPAAGALPVDAFYATVPVSDTGAVARAAGYRMALAKVLLKLSGDSATVNALAQAPGFGPADPLVRQHRYLEEPSGDEQLAPQTVLEVRFNPTRVRERAQDLGLPLWPLERPATLIWVAVERQGQRSLLGDRGEDQTALRAIEQTAGERAVPVVLPLLDLEDQVSIEVADVWAGYADRVGPGASRYATPLLLLARAYQIANGWRSHWNLSGEALGERWISEGVSLDQALAAGVTELANRLGRRLAVATTRYPQRIVLRVTGVEDMIHYGDLIAYLNSLSMVTRADPWVVAPRHMDFELLSDSGVAGLIQALQYGRVLSRVDEPLEPDVDVDLWYRVAP